MSETQNKKLPLIMLPIGMVVAGLITGLPSTIVAILTPIISQELWFSVDPIVYTVVNNVASLIGSLSYICFIQSRLQGSSEKTLFYNECIRWFDSQYTP